MLCEAGRRSSEGHIKCIDYTPFSSHGMRDPVPSLPCADVASASFTFTGLLSCIK